MGMQVSLISKYYWKEMVFGVVLFTNMWDKYSTIVEIAKQQPQEKLSRKVSISSFSKQLNDIFCSKHFHFDDNFLIHLMNYSTQFSIKTVVDSTALSKVLYLVKILGIKVWKSRYFMRRFCIYFQ